MSRLQTFTQAFTLLFECELNFNLTLNVAAIAFFQAGRRNIAEKFAHLNNITYASRNLFTSGRELRRSCDVAHSFAQ